MVIAEDGDILKGHGFSRGANPQNSDWASAPVGRFLQSMLSLGG
jgi:hypothetical protein